METNTERTSETSSNGAKARVFEDRPAVREKVPLLLGLVGPSGGGKTYSALRLASGIQRVSGGEIWCVDTEANRSKHYAERFKFRHVPFVAPFGPLDYLAAIEHCLKKGAGIIIVDSMSHEHEGPGGVLESHELETTRLAAEWKKERDKVQMTAWAKPKAERRRLINSVIQMPCHFLFCFRAKNKLKIEKGKEPIHMGYMPIAGEEFVFEMTMNTLLLPGANGVPTWHSDEIGERQMIKLPEQFKHLFAEEKPLSEDHGEALAKWAAGAPGTESAFARFRAHIDNAETMAELDQFELTLNNIPKNKTLPPAEYKALKQVFAERKKALAESEA
jgi:energy-coupling factor transporter ATP-binding protein EcfA2